MGYNYLPLPSIPASWNTSPHMAQSGFPLPPLWVYTIGNTLHQLSFVDEEIGVIFVTTEISDNVYPLHVHFLEETFNIFAFFIIPQHCGRLKAILVNTLGSRQIFRHFANDIFKFIFLNENVWILLKIWLKFVPSVWINNFPALVQIMAWRRPGNKPLSEPYMHHSASVS